MIPKQSIVEGNKKMHKVQTKKKEERTMDIKVSNTRGWQVWDRMQKGRKCV